MSRCPPTGAAPPRPPVAAIMPQKMAAVRQNAGFARNRHRSPMFPETAHPRGKAMATQNVGTVERVVSSLAGAALIWRALARPSLVGIVAGLGGAALLQRGVTGHCPLYQSLGIDT